MVTGKRKRQTRGAGREGRSGRATLPRHLDDVKLTGRKRRGVSRRGAGSAPRDLYHHGDLRRALIDAGTAIVERSGVPGLTLRAVARRAKVSHNAPYHHFAGKSDLLAAVAAAGFDRMLQTIAELATSNRAATPLDRLRAIGLGYMTFAQQNPSVFRLMFRPELTRPADHPVLLDAEARAFGTLLETIMQCQQNGELPAGDPQPLAAFAWSTVHGLAVLHIEQVLHETSLGAQAFERFAKFINELIVSALKGAKP